MARFPAFYLHKYLYVDMQKNRPEGCTQVVATEADWTHLVRVGGAMSALQDPPAKNILLHS